MAYQTISRRGTALPDSDVAENTKQVQAVSRAWVLSAFGAANATQVSNTAIAIFINGSLQRIAASSGTANAITGTVAATTTAAYIITYSEGGTLSNVMTATFTTLTGYTAPTIPASQTALCIILVAATATAFNGGTNSFGDAAYTVSLYNFVGPAGIALSTEYFTTTPG
jgi:hypothetical protein